VARARHRQPAPALAPPPLDLQAGPAAPADRAQRERAPGGAPAPRSRARAAVDDDARLERRDDLVAGRDEGQLLARVVDHAERGDPVVARRRERVPADGDADDGPLVGDERLVVRGGVDPLAQRGRGVEHAGGDVLARRARVGVAEAGEARVGELAARVQVRERDVVVGRQVGRVEPRRGLEVQGGEHRAHALLDPVAVQEVEQALLDRGELDGAGRPLVVGPRGRRQGGRDEDDEGEDEAEGRAHRAGGRTRRGPAGAGPRRRSATVVLGRLR
jgi:hypothetical protein